MAFEYYAGAGSITFRVTCSDPNTGTLVDPTSITISVRDAPSDEYRHWANASIVQAATPMSSTATGEYYYVWSLASVDPGTYTAQVTATRGGQNTVRRLTVEVQ